MQFDAIADFTLGDTEGDAGKHTATSRAIPEPVLARTALLLVDTLAVAAGAAALDVAQIARDHAVRFHNAPAPGDQATLLFDGRRASLAGAAFAAATQIDNLDAHDGYNLTKGHIGCAVVPALCAFAEARPDLSARAALDALARSYELSARAAIALHSTVSDYHTSGAWNALGVAALGARLRGLSSAQLRHALGIAEYHGPRSQMMREIANPTMLHDGSGPGALTGVMAVLQAEAGFLGAPAITVEAPDVADIWADLGQHWTVPLNYIKPYPICRWAHAALDGLDQIMSSEGLQADAIAKVDVATFAQAAALFPGLPETTSQAQYSLPFALAVLMTKGKIGPEDIMGAGLRDPAVAAALPRIVVREAARHSERFPEGRWSDVTVTLRDGRVLASGDVHAKGGPEAPLSEAEVAQKIDIIATDMPPERRAALWEMRHTLLDPDQRFSDLLRLVHPPVGAAL